MKQTIKSILAFAAVLLCGGAWAGVDETGVQPIYWWTFDGGNLNGDDRAVATKNWSGSGDSYQFSEAGKSVKGGDPYINNNGLNNEAWTAATSFSLVGSFKVNMQTRSGTTDETKALLYGIGWNNDCFILAADRTKAYVMWNSSRVSFTNSGAKSSLETENLVEKLGLGTNDLTTDFHSYALVYDRTNTTLYVYVDGVEVLKKTGVTINLKAGGWTGNYGNAGILSMPGGSEGSYVGAYRTKTECDDYRIYTTVLKPYQLKRLAFNEVATWTSFAAVKGSAITLNSDQGSTYTLTVPAGYSVSEDGALVLGTNGGLNVSSPGGYYTTMELDVANCQADKVLAHVRLGNNAVIVKPENDGKLHQRWSGNQTDYGSCDFENTKRQTVTIAFSGISSTAAIRGTQTFVDGKPAIDHKTGLVASTTDIAWLGIGYQYDNVGVATGMKVYGIRVYARRMSTGTVASSYKAHESAVNATVSAGFDGGTAASTIVGGTAPTGVSEWNANNAAYVNVRGSTTNKAMPTSKSQSGVTDHAPYAGKPAAMTADNDWTVNFVARLPAFAPTNNRDRYAMWGLGPVTYSANNTGIGLVYTAENQVALEKWVKGGTNIKLIGPVTLTEAAKTYHAYTVTYNASAAGGEANPYYTLYIDGVKVGSSSVTDKPSISGNWCVGNYYGGAEQVSADFCNGMLVDDFAIWADTCMTYGAVRDLAAKFPVWPKHLSATVTADTKWSEIDWSEDVTGHFLNLTVSNNAKISFDTTIKCASLTINGDVQIAADEEVFTDGCYIKPLIETEFGITASGTVTLDQTMKTGFVGALSKSDTAIELRAQNKEVISINLTGGKAGGSGQDSEAANVVSDANTLYGLAPTPGNTWNNINRRWQQGGNQTVTLNGPTAYDGQTTATRPTMQLSATAKNTWNADSIQNPFLRGYLDDGNGVTVQVSGIPYTTYDVIIYATSDDASNILAPITVNGTQYTFADGVTKSGNSDWGVGLQATPVFGKNAIMVTGQNLQTLTISSTRTSKGRATLCAVQVINMGGEVLTQRTYASTIETSTTAANLSELQCTGSGSTIIGGELTQVTLTVNGSASDEEFVLTMDDPTIKMEFLKIVGERPVKIAASAALEGISLLDLSETTGNVTIEKSVPKATVGEHARLILGDGATVDNLTNNGGTVRYETTFAEAVTLSSGAGTYEFKNASIGDYCAGNYKIHVLSGDQVTLLGTNARNAPSLDIEEGGIVTFGSSSNAGYWYGTGLTTYTQKGGTVTVPLTGTSATGTGDGILFGYSDPGVTSATISGGEFDASTTVLKLFLCPTLSISGGAVKVKGVSCANDGGSSTVTMTAGTIELGSKGWQEVALNLNGGTLKAVDTSTFSSALAIGGAVTIDVASGQTLTISGAITGSSNITKTGAGTLVITSDLEGYSGQITAQGGLIVSTDNSKVVTDGGKILLTESKAAYAQGNYTIPEGLDDKAVMIQRPTGDIVEKDVVLNDRTVKISGAATNVDVVFNKPDDQGSSEGHPDFKAYQMDYCDIANTYLRFDKNPPVYVEGNEGIYLNNRPYIYGIPHDWFLGTTQLSLAVVGTMPDVDDRVFIHMGSVTGGAASTGNWGLVIATGDISENEVKVYQNHNSTKDLLTTIKVPNATTKRHSYVITKNDDTPGKTIFNIYLDGDPWETIVKDRMTITGGLQVGSAFGGGIEGLSVNNHADPVADYVGCVNVIRAYGREISQAEISKYAEVYPYESPDGTYRREFATSGEQDWKSTASWSSTLASESAGVDVPVRGIVTADFSGDTTVVVNQTESTQYEKLIIDGTGTVTFKKGDGATTIRSVASTIKTPVVIAENSLDLAGGPTTIAGNGHVTFDFTSLTAQGVLTDNEGSASFKVTGVTTATADKFTLNTTPDARLNVALVKHDDNCYYVDATVKPVYLGYNKTTHVYSYVLADDTVVTSFLEGDTIVIDSSKHGDIWQVGSSQEGTAYPLPDLTAYTMKLNCGMNFKQAIPASQKVEVANGAEVYLYGHIAANVTIGGEGNLYPGYVTGGTTIADGVEISCPVVISANELSKGVVIDGAVKLSGTISFAESATSVFKLNKNGTLTVATALAEGKVIGSNAAYVIEKTNNDNGTVTYSVATLATVTVSEETTNYVTLEEAFTAAKENSVPVTIVHAIPGDLTIQEGVTTVNVGNYAIDGAITIPEGSVLTVSATTDSYETHGISGLGKIIVNSGTVNAKNKSGGYAVEDTTVQIDGGTFKLILGTDGAYTGAAGDPTINNAKFVIGSEGALTNNGWVNIVGSMMLSSASEKTVFSGSNFRGAPTVTKSGDGAIMFNLSNANGKAEHKFTSLTLNAGSLTVKSAVAVDSPTSGVDGKVVKKTSGADDTTVYSLVDATPDTPITPEEGEIVVPVVPDAGIAIEPGADVKVPTNTDVSKIEVVYNGVELSKAVEGESGHPKYVEVSINETTGAVELTTTDSAKPAATAIAMATPTEEGADKVQFTITNPIPGLFYAVSSCDTPNGDFVSATGDQATSDAAKTVSIPMTFSGDNKVKYYKVSVKATK